MQAALLAQLVAVVILVIVFLIVLKFIPNVVLAKSFRFEINKVPNNS